MEASDRFVTGERGIARVRDRGSLGFGLRSELYRESDGALMAISMVRKSLTMPNKIKSVQAKPRRFIRSLGV